MACSPAPGTMAPRRKRWSRTKCGQPSMACLLRLLGSSRPSALLRKALIFGLHNVLAVDSFEPANCEMTSSHLLKMLDEGVVDGSATNRTDNRNRLRRDLLRYNHAKAGRHLRNEADQDRSPFLDNTALRDEACGFSDALRQHASCGEISAFGRIGRADSSA